MLTEIEYLQNLATATRAQYESIMRRIKDLQGETQVFDYLTILKNYLYIEYGAPAGFSNGFVHDDGVFYLYFNTNLRDVENLYIKITCDFIGVFSKVELSKNKEYVTFSYNEDTMKVHIMAHMDKFKKYA